MSVMQLKEYHDKYPQGAPPRYRYDEGQSTNCVSFVAVCTYCSHETEGTGSSKKEAQRQAAEKMLQKLCASKPHRAEGRPAPRITDAAVAPADEQNLTDEQKAKAARFLSEFRDDELKDLRGTLDAIDEHRPIVDSVHLGLKDIEPASKTVWNDYEDAIDAFKSAAEEMKLKFTCRVPAVKGEVKSHIVLVHIDRNCLMAGGTGRTFEHATYAACDHAINLLRVLLR